MTESQEQNYKQLAQVVGAFLNYVERYEGYDEPQLKALMDAYGKCKGKGRMPKDATWETLVK